MSNLSERAIQSTDIDAIEAKSYAVKLGYWQDPYIQFFIPESKKKAPEINRGYFARTKSIESIAKEFLMNNMYAQIVSIGAGSDTLYFRLLDQSLPIHKFIELDLPENVFKKVGYMSQRKIFHDKLNLCGSLKVSSSISQDPYYLFSADLRSNPDELINLLRDRANIDLNNPTLFIAECVLVYLNPKVVDQFLETITRNFHSAVFLSYDPINMNDAFGKVMIQNLKMRDIELQGVESCLDKDTVAKRYKNSNFSDVKIWLISEVYKSFSLESLKRIESIEMLDDPEMMKQLFDHYCLTLSSTRPGLLPKDDIQSLLRSVT